ncbi:hypothetical protein IU449_08585 [Nocardia higoensis]|uniref:Alanine rich transmembrane protein n=1 Tax=Nocardia higoensis TaxID=228599 RepID=A0ABS0D7Z8_9NOCA|nr:hypothetical protein [Nocardia higoensis]MBF6354595.1 hypothetical protein [Nocardia higoensis]
MSRKRIPAGYTPADNAHAPYGAPAPVALPDALRDVGEQALVAVRRWADPRERELRKRRRARRRSVRLGTVSGITSVGLVGLVIISAPAWAVVVLGGGAVAAVTGAAYNTRRYLQMRDLPLPPPRFQPRRQPPLRSAARTSIARLVRAERVMHGVTAQIAAGRRLPPAELAELAETAAAGAAALHALAADIVQMEQALEIVGQANPRASSSLAETVRAALARLDHGVGEYEHVLAAASHVLAVPENSVVDYQFAGIVGELRDAADRLDGWAQALTEMADQPTLRHWG